MKNLYQSIRQLKAWKLRTLWTYSWHMWRRKGKDHSDGKRWGVIFSHMYTNYGKIFTSRLNVPNHEIFTRMSSWHRCATYQSCTIRNKKYWRHKLWTDSQYLCVFRLIEKESIRRKPRRAYRTPYTKLNRVSNAWRPRSRQLYLDGNKKVQVVHWVRLTAALWPKLSTLVCRSIYRLTVWCRWQAAAHERNCSPSRY